MLTQVEMKASFNKEEYLKGLDVKQDTLHRLEVCINNEEDAKRYEELIEKESVKWKDKQIAKSFASMTLREEQIDKNPMTFEEFEGYYEIDPVAALRMLFWEKITQDDVGKLMPKWFAERTLKNIYDKHIKSPYDNFFSIVL